MQIKTKKGFTLIELLVVIGIIGLLSSIVINSLNDARNKTYFNRARADSHSIATALELYYDQNDSYPIDVVRNVLPTGLAQFIAGGVWPQGPWPGSVFDWDSWTDPLPGNPDIHQISIRFCPSGGPLSACNFPNESWAQNFDIDSAVYYCVSGACRSHINQPTNYPGYCLNC